MKHFEVSMLSIIYLILLTKVNELSAVKILSVIEIALRSHQVPFQPLWNELARRGHEVTVITTEPQRNSSIKNLKEIDISYCNDIYNQNQLIESFIGENSCIGDSLNKSSMECINYILSHPDVQEIIHNKSIKFDLVIVEARVPSMLAFSWLFNCPAIGVASFDATITFHDYLGNLVHPVVTPDLDFQTEDDQDMSFMDRINSFFHTITFRWFMHNTLLPMLDSQLKKYFGEDLPPLRELMDRISLMLIGTHPILQNSRPVGVNTILVGSGLHLTPPKPLRNDLQTFLDDGKNGVIYFSLGSNVNSNLLTENFKKAIVQAFAEVPYKVLLKMDGELEGVSKNVLVRKWMPQQDILRHKNVKLFITQGGLQSLQEAVVNGVPLIGIPFFGDQITNVNKMVKKGYGLKVNRRTITKEDLVKVINEVMTNPKYRETAEEMGEIFRDEEIPSLQRAVYWTEYVIRHKGAKHLRNPAIGMPTWKYLMLDVLGFLMFIFIAVIVLLYFMIKLLFKFVCYIFRIGKVKKD